MSTSALDIVMMTLVLSVVLASWIVQMWGYDDRHCLKDSGSSLNLPRNSRWRKGFNYYDSRRRNNCFSLVMVLDGVWVKQRLMVIEEWRKDQRKTWPMMRNSWWQEWWYMKRNIWLSVYNHLCHTVASSSLERPFIQLLYAGDGLRKTMRRDLGSWGHIESFETREWKALVFY